jgi:hypothetical protein
METENYRDEAHQETEPSRKPWRTPEVEVLSVDESELSSVVGFDGIAYNS